jgi:multisubunit Na+/H+ antiporter MnhB subunit
MSEQETSLDWRVLVFVIVLVVMLLGAFLLDRHFQHDVHHTQKHHHHGAPTPGL